MTEQSILRKSLLNIVARRVSMLPLEIEIASIHNRCGRGTERCSEGKGAPDALLCCAVLSLQHGKAKQRKTNLRLIEQRVVH